MLVVSSPDIARETLQVHDQIFSNRSSTIATRYLSYGVADVAFANYGPQWREMRKICVMKLFSRQRIQSWEAVNAEVDFMVRALATSAGSAVNVGEVLLALSRNITYRAAFGSNSREGHDEFIKIMQEFSVLLSAFNIADYLPWLRWVDPQGLNKKLAKARDSLDRFIDTIIDDHLQRHKAIDGCDRGTSIDVVDGMLDFYRDETKSDRQNTITFTRENIKAIIMDMMFGGTNTVASVIEWAMAELLKNPADLKRVQQEVADVVGLNRRVQEADLDKLTYLKCALKETLRLHPPIALLHHETADGVIVAGYHVPAKCKVKINAWAIGRDPNFWEDPDTFKPSRFLEENVPDIKGRNFEFLPFGSGRRSCPGMLLGFYTVEMAVAQLVHCFNWELPDGMKPRELDMDDRFGITTTKATRLVAVPTSRLICPY
ncbi:hypothetical protein NMG60_11007901 [Bertholletia excelsa]